MSRFRNAICHAQQHNLSRSGMQLKVWLVHKTSIPSRNAIKKSCVQKVVYTYVSLSFSALQQRQRSHCHNVKMAKVVMGAKKKSQSLARKQTRRCREVRVENNEYEREQQHLAKQIKRVVVLRNNHIFAFCAVQKRTRILEHFQRNAYPLPSFSHFSYFIRCTFITNQPKSMCHAY